MAKTRTHSLKHTPKIADGDDNGDDLGDDNSKIHEHDDRDYPTPDEEHDHDDDDNAPENNDHNAV